MRLILVKSEGQFKHSGRYFLQGGRWHAIHHDQPAPKQHAATPDPVHMPEFQEGKTVEGVRAYYDGVAKKLMDLAAAGDVSALEAMKAKGLEPNKKGKVSNTWAGRTENSKLLLGLYDRIVAHIQGGAKQAAVAHLEQDQKQPDIPAEEKAEDKKLVAELKDKEPAAAVDAAVSHLKEDEGQGDLPAAEKRQDAKLVEKLEAAQGKKAPASPEEALKLMRARLEEDDAEGAFTALSGLKASDLKVALSDSGMFQRTGETKASFLERVRSALKYATKTEKTKYARLKKLEDIAQEYDKARHYRELALGALAAGGYNESIRDDKLASEYASKMEDAKRRFREEVDGGEVPESIAKRYPELVQPAKAVEKKIEIPEQVRSHLDLLLVPARDLDAALSRARQTDKQFNGDGRYAAEVWKDGKERINKMHARIDEMLATIPDETYRKAARDYIESKMPALSLTKQESGYFRDDGPKEGDRNADGLVFRGGRWRRDEPVTVAPATQGVEHAIPKPEPRLILPKKVPAQPDLFADQPAPAVEKPPLHKLLDSMPWDSQKLPDDNKNARSHNRHVDRIRAMAYAGDLSGLEAFMAGSRTNTYGRRQNLLAQTAIAAIKESAPKLAEIDAAAHEAATSPHNDKPSPTQAQAEAGNYAHGHIKVAGLDVTIENPRGSVRSGVDAGGKKWSHTMSDHYGYIKRTTGADGEHVDVYVGPHVESEKVFVVDQLKGGKSGFDEHKVMLGFSSKDEAVAAYRSNFDDGWKVGPVTEMSVDEFKGWLKDGDTSKPVAKPAKPDRKPKAAAPADTSPQEGERNAEGLVFRDGRWHRDEEPAASTADDGLSDDPNSPNYRFKDTGYIAGSRKEEATENIRRAAKSGQRVLADEIDWEEIEKNPREARELIKKSNLFGKVDWAGLREAGMAPGAGFLIDRVYASVASEPDRDSPQKRKDYALGLESLRSRLETCKTPDEVVSTLNEIRDELEGSVLTEEQSQVYNGLMEVYQQKREAARQAQSVLDAYYQDWNRAQNELRSPEYAQEKRIRRGWKPDPDLQKQIELLQPEVEAAHNKWMAYKEDHPELEKKSRNLGDGWTTYENDLEWEASQFRRKADAMMKAVRADNLMSNPVTRAWITLGPKFLAVLNYRRAKGSDAFAGHVTNARRGKITDWSWAEKEGATVKKATKREVQFQLKVAEKYERKGGRDVSVASTAEFKDKFGLRDVQSGNWVLNDPNSAAWHVQKSTEAFSDLADLLGATDKDVSLNGRLAMAFGARGRGNAGFGGAARAHYESVQRVINLTKMGGGGTLAHEWAHSLDNLCVEAESGNPAGADDFASENPDLLPAGDLRDAFKAVRSAMLDGDIQANNTLAYSGSDVKLADYNINRTFGLAPVAQKIKYAGNVQAAVKAVDDYFGDTTNMTPKRKKQVNDWRRMAVAYYDRNPEGGEAIVKAGPGMSSFAAEAVALDGGRSTSYWSQTHEMFARAFQSYVEDKLEAGGRRNDYLSAMADNKYYFDPIFGQQKPFPEGEERTRINAAFDKLIAAMQKSGTLAKAALLLA